MAVQQVEVQRKNSIEIKLSRLKKSPSPLRSKDSDVEELRKSIIRYGLLHPLTIRKDIDGELEVVSGNRRLKALQEIGATYAPCQILDVSEKEAFEIALIENLQRKSLDPVEEAMAFRQYIQICKWGKRNNLARRVGKSEEYISHRLKILELPPDIIESIGRGLSASHAEELAWVENSEARKKLADAVISEKLTVRQLHELAEKEKNSKTSISRRRSPQVFDSFTEEEHSSPDLRAVKDKIVPDARILQTTILALRYVLSHIDSNIRMLDAEGDRLSMREFLIGERYKIHQLLDEFIRTEVSKNRM